MKTEQTRTGAYCLKVQIICESPQDVLDALIDLNYSYKISHSDVDLLSPSKAYEAIKLADFNFKYYADLLAELKKEKSIDKEESINE